MKTKPDADLVELFSSIQGEGLFIGARQIFLRLPLCNLSCGYCDTDYCLPLSCRIEEFPGSGSFRNVENPVPYETVYRHLSAWKEAAPLLHHSLSITGGEPLMHAGLLKEWLPGLRTLFPVFLETNGTMYEELAAVIDLVDYVSMDMKLPSTTNCEDLFDVHRKFLEIAAAKNVYVKAVASDDTPDSEIDTVCRIIAEIDRRIPLVIQPVTRRNGSLRLSPSRALELQQVASNILAEVRVIPQMHKVMGVL